MPLPNSSGGSLQQSYAQPQNNDQGVIRVDYNLNARHLLTARYNQIYSTQISIAGNIPTYETIFNWARVQSATASDTWTVTSAMVNELRLAYNRFSPEYQVQNGVSLHDLGGNFPVLNGVPIPPNITISSPSLTLGSNSSVNAQLENEDYQIKDTLHWTHGNHTVAGGAEGFRRRYLNRSYYYTMGAFNFTGGITGNAHADFLLGKPATETVAFPLTEQGGVQTSYNSFIHGASAAVLPSTWASVTSCPGPGFSRKTTGPRSIPASNPPSFPARRSAWSITAIKTFPAAWSRPIPTISPRASVLRGTCSATAARRFVAGSASSTTSFPPTSFRTSASLSGTSSPSKRPTACPILSAARQRCRFPRTSPTRPSSVLRR
jgi:hypothetical protein